MKCFKLKIGTTDGMIYDGEAESIGCRSVCGDVTILAGHSNYCTALGEGKAAVVFPDGSRRTAKCKGGILSVMNGMCRVFARRWEWLD